MITEFPEVFCVFFFKRNVYCMFSELGKMLNLASALKEIVFLQKESQYYTCIPLLSFVARDKAAELSYA